jgi:plastocyanin
MRRALTLVSAFVLAGALVSACSSSGSKGAASGGPSVTVHAKNFAFNPMVITMKQGKITFVVANSGSVEHNLTVPGLKVDKDVEPGKTESVTVTAKPGTYPFHCEYHPKLMKGTITITS